MRPLDDQIDALSELMAPSFARIGPRAAYAAMLTARGYGIKSESATAASWRTNAARLLADQPDCVEQGHLKLRQGSLHMYSGEVAKSVDLLREARDSGRRFGDRNLWALAVHLEGQALLRLGDVDTGMALIDEAAAAALGNERRCEHLRSDLLLDDRELPRPFPTMERAAQWTDAAGRWCSASRSAASRRVPDPSRRNPALARRAWAEADRWPVRPRSTARARPQHGGGRPWLSWARCSDGWGGWRMPRNPSTVPGSSAGRLSQLPAS